MSSFVNVGTRVDWVLFLDDDYVPLGIRVTHGNICRNRELELNSKTSPLFPELVR